jgi:hypothetical protein
MPALAHRLPIFFFEFALLLASAACSPGAGTPPGAEGNAPPPGDCGQDNLTEACSCGDRGGRQVCLAGAWSGCECADAPANGGGGASGAGLGAGGSSLPTFAGNLRTDITFAWQSTAVPVADGSCPPGQYEGNLQGWYWSILAPGGLAVPITNVDFPGAPSGFHFELSPAQGGEITQAVKGEVDGLADALFPFKAQILGELNCRTGSFTGHLSSGTYSILTPGLLPQNFDGVMSAHYDKRTHTFVNGIWDVKETSATPPGTLAPFLPRDFARDGFGGAGEFAAALPTDVKDPALTTCPANFTCGPHLLGPNKLLCNNAFGTPTCVTDADCNTQFPGEGVLCLKASLFSLCVRECKP